MEVFLSTHFLTENSYYQDILSKRNIKTLDGVLCTSQELIELIYFNETADLVSIDYCFLKALTCYTSPR